jgi:hypothetical protein
MRIEVVQQDAGAVGGLSEADVALLTRHATYGWLILVYRAAVGRSSPFILQTMQLIYCADVADYVAYAGAIGRFLLRRGSHSMPTAMKDLVGLYRKK